MSRTTVVLSVRRMAWSATVVGVLIATLGVPVAAREPAGSAAPSPRSDLVAHLRVARLGEAALRATRNAPPVDTRDEALAAGGRRADGGRTRTVMRQGIDVSHWQGRIRWPVAARNGVHFAIAKATEGTWMVDRWYHRNKRRAQNSGILFTAYHFANPSRERNDAIREADWFLKHADLQGSNLLPALDLEQSGGLRPDELRRWTLQWMRRVERKLGVKPMLYTSPGFWTGNVANSRRVARAGFDVLWLSHWQTRRPSVPARRWNGHGWTIWQWTESGRIPGISGWVDRNVYSGPKLHRMTIRAIRREGRPGRGDEERGRRDDRSRRPAPR